MDCGVPFCHEGCPLGNLIPDWNDLVYRDKWQDALVQLHATNNFPEFTGRICPAPCESACVLAINDDPVAIEQIEMAIVERGFDEGWIAPEPPERRTGKTVGVVGSGPAGLAVAAELNKSGHTVTVYERDEGPGGLMRFGVPDAKLPKVVIDRRAALLEAEGVRFEYGVDVGVDVTADELRERHDALVVAIGSRVHRDVEVPGRELDGIHFAMDYLYQRNRWVAAQEGRPSRAPEPGTEIVAAGKRVVVIGGGDTGMDCISNANREGATAALDPRRLPGAARRRPRRALAVAAAAQAHADDVRAGGGRRALVGDARSRASRATTARVTRGPRPPRDRHLLARPAAGPRQRVHGARPTSC